MKRRARYMRDQYGQRVNVLSLVLLPTGIGRDEGYWKFDPEGVEVKKVLNAPWYEVAGILMAPFKSSGGLSEDDPADVGIDFEKLPEDAELLYVAHALHRFNPKDGFYHA